MVAVVSPIVERREVKLSSRDVRAERPRNAILDAVHDLTRADSRVTVSAIIRAAGISRSTFYAHYASLDELATSLLSDGYRQIAAAHAASLSERVQARAADSMAHLMERLYELAPPPAGISAQLSARYTAEATTGLLDAWVRGEVHADAEQMVGHLLALMPAWTPRWADDPLAGVPASSSRSSERISPDGAHSRAHRRDGQE